ncbi:glycogen/starch synthase [Arthrobacter sp. OVS8]|nr:glycogen/starch synthase [Arthrobacter sp. OVS8]
MDTALTGGHGLLPPIKLRPSRSEGLPDVDEVRSGAPSEQTRRILFASAEAYPFVKVGGLADVSSALPKRLAELGFDVRLVIPGYRGLGGNQVQTFEVPLGPIAERVVVRRLPPLGGVDVFALDIPGWFDREVPYSYHDDDVMPFVLFSKAITTLAAQDGWRPDVIHCNDWHCGLVAQDARQGPHRSALERTGIVFTIHNIAYQGRVGAATDKLTGLPPAGTMLERGIAFADRVNTVSPRYLREILTPAQGAGMDGLLRDRGDAARGILNGIDYEEFNPGTTRGSPPATTARSPSESARTRMSCSGSATWIARRTVRCSAWSPGWYRRREWACCPRHWSRSSPAGPRWW